MKKVLLLLAIIFIGQIVFGAQKLRNDSVKLLKQENAAYSEKCAKLADVFKYDTKFNLYLKSTCIEFDNERKRTVDIVYPIKVDGIPNYSKNLYTYRTDFSRRLNTERYNSYKTVINEYCKIHSKVNPKAQQACLNANALF